MNEFTRKILKVDQTRIHKVTNSFGVYDAYKYIGKNRWLNIGQPITSHQFYTIVRTINKYYAEQLAKGFDFKMPCRLGVLELRKTNSKIEFKNGKLKTNLHIDWKSTLALWELDEESYNNKTLIRLDEKEIFKIYYNKTKANYNNKFFYQFKLNREIKKKLKHNIKEEGLDAFKFNE